MQHVCKSSYELCENIATVSNAFCFGAEMGKYETRLWISKPATWMWNQHCRGILYPFADGRYALVCRLFCCPKRRLNEELTGFHQEVLSNLNSIHGALLRMNRRIQAEGVYGGIKRNRSYTRARRKGLEGVIFEIALISCSFNLHKYHLKKSAGRIAA